MKAKILILICATLASIQAQAASFTLEGYNPFSYDRKCALFDDDYGYDESLPGPNKFFAIVRTSYEPQKVFLMIAHAKMKSQMVAVDSLGRPTTELSIRLVGPPKESTLRHAQSYKGYVRGEDMKWSRLNCQRLNLQE